MVPPACATRSAWVKSRAALRSRSASPQVSAAAISGAMDRALGTPPAARPVPSATAADLAGCGRSVQGEVDNFKEIVRTIFGCGGPPPLFVLCATACLRDLSSADAVMSPPRSRMPPAAGSTRGAVRSGERGVHAHARHPHHDDNPAGDARCRGHARLWRSAGCRQHRSCRLPWVL
jgi:hypothetical protein